jgi:hypothetical protein
VGSAYPFQAVLYTNDLLGKIIVRWSPLTIFVRLAKFPPHQDESGCSDQPADPWQGGFPDRGCGRETRQTSGLSASPCLDRRQLLASAAALGVGNIPGVETAADVTNSGPAVPVAEIARSETAAWNVCAGTARKIKEIAARNIIRAEAGLPLLSVPQELRRMKEVADAMAFEEFAGRHRQAVWEEVLEPVRRQRGDPNWHPTRLMEGFAFQAQVNRILRERFKDCPQ